MRNPVEDLNKLAWFDEPYAAGWWIVDLEKRSTIDHHARHDLWYVSKPGPQPQAYVQNAKWLPVLSKVQTTLLELKQFFPGLPDEPDVEHCMDAVVSLIAENELLKKTIEEMAAERVQIWKSSR